MKEQNGFYTLKGYQKNDSADMTSAMEDYLEMICRILQQGETVKVGELSQRLHVKPSSVTKMVQQLTSCGYLHSEKYGLIYLTQKGSKVGKYLLYRHDVLFRFLCILNHSQDELEEAEKIEHFLTPATIHRLDELTKELEITRGKTSAELSQKGQMNSIEKRPPP